jgi:putative membrane protein
MNSDRLVERTWHPWKGVLAGALGGIVATFAMGKFHALFQNPETSSSQDEEDSTVKAASAILQGIFHHELTPEEKKIAGPVMDYAFGTSMAAIYGAVVELAPVARAGWGTVFGATVWLGAHVITVPALGLSEPITRSTPASEGVEMGAHLVYGVVTESVRRLIRTAL